MMPGNVFKHTDMIRSTAASKHAGRQNLFQMLQRNDLLNNAVRHNECNILSTRNHTANFAGDLTDLFLCHASRGIQRYHQIADALAVTSGNDYILCQITFIGVRQRIIIAVQNGIRIMVQHSLPGNLRGDEKTGRAQQVFRNVSPVGIRMVIFHCSQNPLPQKILLIRIQFQRQMKVNSSMMIGDSRQRHFFSVPAG